MEINSDINDKSPTYLLRPPRPGDMSDIIARHGALYTSEHGWDMTFEADVARPVADIIEKFDPDRERVWVAESKHTLEFLGCITLVKDRSDDNTAQLRWLIVEAASRGMGLGAKLVEETVAFSRAKGYSRIVLWTYSFLEGARRIYSRAGFRLVRVDPVQKLYKKNLVNEV